MKKEKMYVRMTIAALSVLIVFVAYLYVSGAFKERPNIRAYEKEEKTDTREPKDIYIGAEDDSGSEAGSETIKEDTKHSEGETGEDPEEGGKDEGTSSEDIISYSLADEEELEDLRARRNEILRGKEKENKGNKEKDQKDDKKVEENRTITGKSKYKVTKLDKEIKYNLPTLKDKKTVDIVYHEYSYLNEEDKEIMKKESEVNEMAEYFEDKAYEEDLSYINEGERWYQGGQPRSSDVKIENGKKYVYVYGYDWLPWAKYKGATNTPSDLGKDPDRGIIIGEFQ